MKLTKQILESILRGINLAIDDFDDIDIEAQKVGQIKNSYNTRDLIIDKYFVDLGLPSGTLWGKYNVGVDPNRLNNAQDWYGNYYAWGEIEKKQDYSWKTYKFANGNYDKLTKYCNNVIYCDKNSKPDNLTILQDEDDVAVQTNKLPFDIKMPTKELIDELLEYTTSKWVENYQDIAGLNGRTFISKQNDNEIFIPAAGYYIGLSIYDVGSYCCMWSCSLILTMPNHVHGLCFYLIGYYQGTHKRCNGFSARPVLINQKTKL